jgi:catechol 2,3-dioxygenase-like lactoylglutathione lyase family enzyme
MRLHHVQVCMPGGQEHLARDFYRDALGLAEVDKPGDLAGRGGCWFRATTPEGLVTAEIHVAAQQPFVPATRGHPALQVSSVDELLRLGARVEAAGFEVSWDERYTLPGYQRFHCRDGFGNRVEVLCGSSDA